VLPDLDNAIDRLLRAVRERETVAIFGDFDVDGVTSAAQLSQAIASLGGVPVPYVPDRFSEATGSTSPQSSAAPWPTLPVTADTGTTVPRRGAGA
jgi:single-stranded-DNA-specific exonuclease